MFGCAGVGAVVVGLAGEASSSATGPQAIVHVAKAVTTPNNASREFDLKWVNRQSAPLEAWFEVSANARVGVLIASIR